MRGLSFAEEELLFDPQTSGGLLFAIDADCADEFVKELEAEGLPCARIGALIPRMAVEIIVDA